MVAFRPPLAPHGQTAPAPPIPWRGGNEMYLPDQDARHQIAADKIERLADDYARANTRPARERNLRPLRDAARALAAKAAAFGTKTAAGNLGG